MYHNMFEFSLMDSISSIIIIAMTIYIFAGVSKKYRNNYFEGLLIYSYHSIWGIIFMILSQYYGFSDSSGWFTESLVKLHYGELPNSIIDFTNYTQNYLMYVINLSFSLIGLKYLSINLIFNFFSSIGLFFFYMAINNKNIPNFYSLIILVLLPSFMFWTSGVSKDCLILFPIGILIFYCNKFEKNLPKIFILIFIILLIRPYLGFLIYFSLLFFYLINIFLNSKFKISNIFFLFLSGVLSIIILNYIWGINNISNIYSHINTMKSQYQDALLAIPPDQNPLIRILSYYFRPALFDFYNNFYILIISIENLILFLIILFLIFNLNYKNLFLKKENIFLIFLILITSIFFSQFTNNYGTAFRQKWMTLPFIIFFLISNQKVYYFYNKRKL